MNILPPVTDLIAGDHLLYASDDLVGWIIRVKTWSPVSHIEVYAGGGSSLASRDGIGVNKYPLRTEGLFAVLRPVVPFNLSKAEVWFNTHAKGQKYDWLGLLCFTLAVKQGSPDKEFCSEFITNLDRAGDFDSFHANWDADRVSPGMFLQSPMFSWVWLRNRF